ncbi:unnamed protein product, partial [Mesorhabditis belari]|uniref:Uncharacterized protein n=1 Tax=Mesorhabditis belari TaxID=2138241 RepID=A0AAF3EW56_9BILA
MVRQKNEPNKIDGRKRDSIGETWRDERNDEDKGKPIVPVQQQHNDAQEEADRLLHKWEMNPEPSEEYLRIIDENRYMMKISEKASNKSNARFWFNVKKIEDKYARRDPDKEIIYDFKMKKVFVSKAITDEEALKQMQKLTEMPEFGESVLSCFDSSTQEDDSPAQKRVNRQRGALNKIFEMQYESCPLALLPKEPTLQLPPPPVLLPVEGVPTERETRKRTITITGAASEVLRIISSTNNIFALFSNEKPALTGDATVEKKNEAEPTVEKNVEKLDANHMKCVKEELIDFPVNSMMNNADLTNRRSSRRKTIDNAFNDESMQIVKRKPKDFEISPRQPSQSVQKSQSQSIERCFYV